VFFSLPVVDLHRTAVPSSQARRLLFKEKRERSGICSLMAAHRAAVRGVILFPKAGHIAMQSDTACVGVEGSVVLLSHSTTCVSLFTHSWRRTGCSAFLCAGRSEPTRLGGWQTCWEKAGIGVAGCGELGVMVENLVFCTSVWATFLGLL
jgi:hypothetical protein